MKPISGLIASILLLGACAGTGRPAPGGPRVYHGGEAVAWEDMMGALSEAEVVFVGEQHDDSVAHRLELRIAEELGRRRPLVVAMEMFERDVQGPLDRYLAGTAAEPEFLSAARPWRNYPSDYRPVVELARTRGWPVVASNVPRRLASAVARGGMETLDTLAAAERGYAAAARECPEDEYYRRFVAEMGEHPGMDAAAVHRIYLAQCLKDETMATSVVEHLRPGAVTLHLNGAFHSDFRLGIVPRVERRRPGTRMAVVSLVRAERPLPADSVPGDFVGYTGP
jgi:uncharacterized iron-regulated protein